MSLSPEAKVIQTLFSIQDKTGKKVPFQLNPAQTFLDQETSQPDGNKIIIAKARQKGFSAGILAKFTVRCLGREGTHAVVMSHESEATQRLLDRVHYYLKHLKGPRPIFGRNSRNELYFPKTESTYYIGTAGSKTFGRGDWVTDLHCSEYAWWEDAVKHQAGVFQAVPMSGRIIIESTGNGRNNDFYYIWKHADKMGYKRLFYPWFSDQEYSLPTEHWKPDTPKYNPYLLELKSKHKLTDNQMKWYESKLQELRENLKLMQQEYPSEPEECFQATGGSLFSVQETFNPLWKTERLEGYFTNLLKGHPKKGYHYVIGADPSGGTGNDDAAIQIFCCETWEQILEFFNNSINPIDFGRFLSTLGRRYNYAYITVEGNNHGLAVIPILKESYDKVLLYKNRLATTSSPAKYGWMNSQQAKFQLVGLLTEGLPQTLIYGRQTVEELNSFEETPEGRFEGKSDNCVVAMGLALMGLERNKALRGSHIPKPMEVKPKLNYMSYTLDEVLENLRKRSRGSTYFPKQTGEGYV